MSATYTELNNGIKIPFVGIGTFLLEPADAENSVREALKMGYRLIDTAHIYSNEKAVGRGIRASGVKREDIFVSTKLWPCDYENPNAVNESLERLGLDYIDLLFLHQPAGNYLAGYKQLEKAYKDGKIKSIGVSNFEGKYMDDILANCEVVPQVVQNECHPYFVQAPLRAVTDPKNIKLMSWYPLGGKGNGSIMNEAVVKELAKKYNKSTAQIILRWHTQMGFIIIPGSKNVDHIKDNFNIFDFELSKEDMDKMASLNKDKKYIVHTPELINYLLTLQPNAEN